MIHTRTTKAIALLLCVVMAGCTANWIQVALNDLPVLIQIATNIINLVGVVQGSTSAADQAAVQNIGQQAQQDLTLIQTLYNEYKANPNTTTLQKIQTAIATTDQNLPALLQSAHISNLQLVQKVTAAVDLILTTVDVFATLIPAPAPAVTAKRRSAVAGQKPLTPKQLKTAWLGIAGVPLK